MTVENSHMKSLYKKLHTVGYNQKYVQSLLPDWWDDEIAETPAGLQQASLILGQIFGVYAETLWTKDAEPKLKFPQDIHCMHSENTDQLF